ncbi:hypothetical protein GCM10028856_31920 [Halopiger thermotolerans]
MLEFEQSAITADSIAAGTPKNFRLGTLVRFPRSAVVASTANSTATTVSGNPPSQKSFGRRLQRTSEA